MSTLNVLSLPTGVTLADVFVDGDQSYVTLAGFDGDDAIVSTKTGVVRIARSSLPENVVPGLRLYVNAEMVIVGNNLDFLTKCDDQPRSTSQGCISSANPLSMI